jgi:hypothetical protein
MINRYIKAILINIAANSHRLIWPTTLSLLFFLLSSLNFVLNVIEVVFIFFDHFLTFPQLFQGIISQMHGLLDPSHFKGSYVEWVVIIIGSRMLHGLSKIK